jgi:hypothetical protein
MLPSVWQYVYLLFVPYSFCLFTDKFAELYSIGDEPGDVDQTHDGDKPNDVVPPLDDEPSQGNKQNSC